MRASELVLHVGVQHSGTVTLNAAAVRLRRQLRAAGVAYLGSNELLDLNGGRGWPDEPAVAAAESAGFVAALGEGVEAELRRTFRSSGLRRPAMLISSDYLLGRSHIGSADRGAFRPCAEATLAPVLETVDAERTTVLLYTIRQDRLMELCHLRELLGGSRSSIEEQFGALTEPSFDYTGLLDRIAAIPGVDAVRVRPCEIAGADPFVLVGDLLAALGVADLVEASAAGELRFERVLTREGAAAARGVSVHLETDTERRRMGEFLKEHFASDDGTAATVLDPGQRAQVLAAHREGNERLFEKYLPALPRDSYADEAATARLAGAAPRAPASDGVSRGQALRRRARFTTAWLIRRAGAKASQLAPRR